MKRTDARFIIALGLAFTFGCVTRADAADTFTVPAVQAAYIRPAGPQQGANGERYLDVQGKNTGDHACYGVVRFDGKRLKSDLDAKYGAGKYRITGLTLELTQSNAKFTKDGGVLIFFSLNDAPDVTTLKYPFDSKAAPLFGQQIATVKFVKGADTAAGQPPAPSKVDDYDLTTGATKMVKGDALIGGLTRGKVVTLVLVEGDPDVAATWAGLKPVGTRKPPVLIIKATPK